MVIELSLNLNLIIYMYVCMGDFDIVMNFLFWIIKEKRVAQLFQNCEMIS